MTTVGTGIIILAVLWSLAILVWILALRLGVPYVFAGFASLALAAILTVVLWAIPKGPLPPEDPTEMVDQAYAGRVALITICGIMCFLGITVVASMHLFEQIYATPPKNFVS